MMQVIGLAQRLAVVVVEEVGLLISVQVTHGLGVRESLKVQTKLPAHEKGGGERTHSEENVQEVVHVGFFLG